jgi:predicted GIY-YIG superfamily endonuclease
MGLVYLIHLDTPLAHSSHYIGFTKSISPLYRLRAHRAGVGANFLRAVNEAGIGYHVVRIWRWSSQDFERSLKNRKKASVFCPICNPKCRRLRYRHHKL